MSADLAALNARLLVRLGLPSTDGMFPTGTLDQLVNDGLKAMATDYDWPWLVTVGTITTTAGEETYATPTSPQWTRTLWIAHETTDLKYRQRRDLISLLGFQGEASRGRPLYYAISADSIVLAPTPDSAYTLVHSYVRTEPPLVNGTDAAICPTHYDEIIVLYAMKEAAMLLKDTTMFQMASAEIAEWKRRISDNVRRSASPVRVSARRDWSM